MNKLMLLPFLLMAFGAAKAEEADTAKTQQAATPDEAVTNLKGQVDGLNESYLETKGTVDKLAKLKVSGYIQAQWQHADTNGGAAGAFAGGGFASTSNQRFQLRRVRLKTTYDAGTSQYIMELEARPSGVALKDAEVILKEPWLNTFSLDLGLMDRPFGFEIPYSSSAHEAPERTRVYQTVFKDEKDLGVKVEINPTEKMGFLQYLNLKSGLYTGTAGYGGGTGDEIDSTVDFIGRAGFKAPFNDLNLAIDGGVSYYQGYILGVNDTMFTLSGTALAPSTGVKNHLFDRDVMGGDMQIYYSIPVIGDVLGGTSIRGEYLAGKTIGTLGASQPYGASTSAMVERNFMGWYASWIQNWGSMFQSVIKFDVYDPNTDVEGSDVGVAANGKLSATDLQYTTLGMGLIYYWDANVKLTAYYDMITNEEASAGAFSKDLNDNVLTLRAQVKF
ncbi:MAG: hypothetical protein JWO30_1564 [Fibrobacteres bacterium]|nr:hypothetical protein [Fibrobacterota bacterium]